MAVRRVEVTGTFSAPGQSASARVRGDYNLTIGPIGGATFTAKLERSTDNGVSWSVIPEQVTGLNDRTKETTEVHRETTNYTLVRLNCTAVSGGIVPYAITQ